MPLTISHPAASVPFSKFGLVLSALAIGSLIPDYPYFVPFYLQSGFSHSISGLFVFCLPMGLVSLAIFHYLIKYPALSLFPVSHQSRLYSIASGFSFWPLQRFLLIILSLLLGAFTHIFWDSFTHPKGWMVQKFVILKSQVFIAGYSVPVYSFLQHSSTIVGMGLMLYWYFEWYKRAKIQVVPANLSLSSSTKTVILVALALASLVIAVFSGLLSVPLFETSLHYRLFVGQVFVAGVSAFIFGLTLFSVYYLCKTTAYGSG